MFDHARHECQQKNMQSSVIPNCSHIPNNKVCFVTDQDIDSLYECMDCQVTVHAAHPMCCVLAMNANSATNQNGNGSGRLRIEINPQSKIQKVHKVQRKMHRYSWRFLCAEHCADECLNEICRLEMLKVMQREWSYWKLHPNPMTTSSNGKDRMLRIYYDQKYPVSD